MGYEIKRNSSVHHALSYSGLWTHASYNFLKYEPRGNSSRTYLEWFVSFYVLPSFPPLPFRPSFVSIVHARADNTIQCNEPMSNTRETRPLLFSATCVSICTHACTYSIKMKMLPRGTHTWDFECSFVESTSYRDLLFTSSIGELPIALYTGIFVPLGSKRT